MHDQLPSLPPQVPINLTPELRPFHAPLGDAWEQGKQFRHHASAKGRSDLGRILVGRILDPLEAGFNDDRPGLRPAEAEHRSHQIHAGNKTPARTDAPKPGRSAAAGQPHEQRLDLILGLVTRGDEATSTLLRQGSERLKAADPGRGFVVPAVGACPHVPLDQFNANRATDGAGVLEILKPLFDRAVIVHHVRGHHVLGVGSQAEQKGRRVDPPGKGDQRSASGVGPPAPPGQSSPKRDNRPLQGRQVKVGSSIRVLGGEFHTSMILCLSRAAFGPISAGDRQGVPAF